MIKINSNSDNCLVAIDNNGKEYEITYEMLGKYSEYANEDDVEGYFFHVIDDKYVAGAVLWASGQGGMIVVWDCEMGKLVHVSEGAYAVTVAIHHDMVYFLADVSHWGDAPKQAFGIETDYAICYNKNWGNVSFYWNYHNGGDCLCHQIKGIMKAA